MPHDTAIEKALIASLLLTPKRFGEVVDRLSNNDFYSDHYRVIWKAMENIYNQGKDIDLVLLQNELKNEDDTQLGVNKTLIDCCSADYTLGKNLLTLVDAIKNKSLLRRIISVNQNNALKAQLDDIQAISLLGEMEKDVVEISEQVIDKRPNDVSGILAEIHKDMVQGEKNKWRGYQTGFKWLDQQTGGFIPTQCWVIGSATGTGKTFFTLQLILNILEQGAKICLFSTEMDRKTNMLRLIGNLAGIGTIKIMKGLLDENERKQVKIAANKLKKFNKQLMIYDNVYSVEEIRLKAKKQKLSGGLDIVIVDFIQNLRGAESIYERMSNAAIQLQQIAQELDVTVVITSQVSQASIGWKNSNEAIGYKGAGEIAAIADVGVWINRVEDDVFLRNIILRKVRHGIPGQFRVRMSFPSGRVIDVDDELLTDNLLVK